MVRILECRGRVVDADFVAAEFGRQGAPFGLAGENVDRCHGCRGEGEKGDAGQSMNCAHLCVLSEFVSTMSADAHEVLNVELIVGDARLRAVARELQTQAAEFTGLVIDDQ